MNTTTDEDPSLTARILGDNAAAESWWPEVMRLLTGATLASTYGLALGTREGGLALLHHALGVPAALLAVATMGVPALWVLLTLFDAPVSPLRIAHVAARTSATTGLVLAGLAPTAALYVVSSDGSFAAGIAAGLGLFVAGVLGLRVLVRGLNDEVRTADTATRAFVALLAVAFALFATVLAARVWWVTLPVVGGVS